MPERHKATLRLSPIIAAVLQKKASKESVSRGRFVSRNELINEALEQYVYRECILELRSINPNV